MSTKIALMLILLLVSYASAAEPCVIELKDEAKRIHLTVESCRNIGTFSVGGLYEGSWEKLSYFYPKPWKGTFISIRLGDVVYTNSVDSQGRISLDPYVIRGPELEEDSILTVWRLPEDVLVEQRFELIDEGILLSIALTNEGTEKISSGIRLHIDTMLGWNDGAPIYVPGDGLKSREAEYSGSRLDFRYWKAYDSIETPSLIATGVLNDRSYPTKVVVANWKKSIHSSWGYVIDPKLTILGDSAVLLYYDLGDIEFGQKKTIYFRYINGESILPPSKGYFGIAEIIPDKLDAIYCPGAEALLKVDVVSRIDGNEGYVSLEVSDEDNKVVYSKREYTGVMEADSVRNIPFRWQTPVDIATENFNVVAVLYDKENNEVDRKKTYLRLDRTACAGSPKIDLSLIILVTFILIGAISVFAAFYYTTRIRSNKPNVEVIKERESDRVKVVVWNKGYTEVRDCVIIDEIAEGAEVDVITSGVERRDTELFLYVGKLKGGEKAILEYKIKDLGFLPPAVVRWNSGEEISSKRREKQ